MILLISPYQNATECAAQIERALQEDVKTVNTLRLAIAALRSQDFSLLIADENLIESEPGSSDKLMQRLETAAPVIIDMACLRPDKIASLALATRKRQALEFQLAHDRALNELRSEMKSELTGLLISSEMALKSAGLPTFASEKLNLVLEIARRMQSRLNPKES